MTQPVPGIRPDADIYSALLDFQRRAHELTLTKDARSNYNEYLTLDGLVSEVRPLLVECGIAYTQMPGFEQGEPTLTTTLVHPESSTSLSATMLLREAKKDPQGQGAAITYARRYQLMSMLGLVADVDDDAAKTSTSRKTQRAAGTISSKQRRELMEAIRSAHIATDRAIAIVKEVAGVEKSEDIPAAKYAEVLKAIKDAA